MLLMLLSCCVAGVQPLALSAYPPLPNANSLGPSSPSVSSKFPLDLAELEKIGISAEDLLLHLKHLAEGNFICGTRSSSELQKHYLRNHAITCNDGSRAGWVVPESGSRESLWLSALAKWSVHSQWALSWCERSPLAFDLMPPGRGLLLRTFKAPIHNKNDWQIHLSLRKAKWLSCILHKYVSPIRGVVKEHHRNLIESWLRTVGEILVYQELYIAVLSYF